MKETIERNKADAPAELKKRIRELEGQIAKGATSKSVVTTATNSTALSAVKESNHVLKNENADLKRRLDDRQRKATKLVSFMSRSIKPLVEVLEKVIEEFQSDAPVAAIADVVVMPAPEKPRTAIVPAKPIAPRVNDGTTPRLTGNALKIAAIAAGYSKRNEGIDKKVLAAMCGASMGGSFSARISEARTAGAVTTEGTMVYATPEGDTHGQSSTEGHASLGGRTTLFAPDRSAAKRFIEFFTANIRNPNTRRAYTRAATEFANWCELNDLRELRDIEPVHVAISFANSELR